MRSHTTLLPKTNTTSVLYTPDALDDKEEKLPSLRPRIHGMYDQRKATWKRMHSGNSRKHRTQQAIIINSNV